MRLLWLFKARSMNRKHGVQDDMTVMYACDEDAKSITIHVSQSVGCVTISMSSSLSLLHRCLHVDAGSLAQTVI